MKFSTFLQLFLIINIFLAGAVAVVAFQQGHAHRRQKAKKDSLDPEEGLSEADRQRMIHDAEAHFQTTIGKTVDQLQHDMTDTTSRINTSLEKLGTEIVGKELESYREDLDRLRKQLEINSSNVKLELSKHEIELKETLDKSMEIEKAKLIQQLDTKLADAVSSFLIETLQHNVDLGAQASYLTAQLEEHKDELIKEVNS